MKLSYQPSAVLFDTGKTRSRLAKSAAVVRAVTIEQLDALVFQRASRFKDGCVVDHFNGVLELGKRTGTCTSQRDLARKLDCDHGVLLRIDKYDFPLRVTLRRLIESTGISQCDVELDHRSSDLLTERVVVDFFLDKRHFHKEPLTINRLTPQLFMAVDFLVRKFCGDLEIDPSPLREKKKWPALLQQLTEKATEYMSEDPDFYTTVAVLAADVMYAAFRVFENTPTWHALGRRLRSEFPNDVRDLCETATSKLGMPKDAQIVLGSLANIHSLNRRFAENRPYHPIPSETTTFLTDFKLHLDQFQHGYSVEHLIGLSAADSILRELQREAWSIVTEEPRCYCRLCRANRKELGSKAPTDT